jgi:cytochrome P450
MEFARKLVSAYKKKQMSSSFSSSDSKEENTLIKLLVENAGSDEEVAAEGLSWLTAGHDTTGYSLSNALVVLSKHPEIQTKLRHELSKATKAGEPPDRVEYFQFFLKEMSRYLPVAAMGSIRVTGKDYMTKDGLVLPAGAVCFLPQYVANHNAGVFGDTVNEFDPDRWQNATRSIQDQCTMRFINSRWDRATAPDNPWPCRKYNRHSPCCWQTMSLNWKRKATWIIS